ncbi:hypothetical protein BGZ83_002282 [Gryganskiella cystojenkinii]|nr:hypothetical protein BGZ83_002282 [Gryganskiella cystojenkinii]
MRCSFLAIASAIATTFVMAAPTARFLKRDVASDVGILNYALTLEHLEANFYNRGLAKFSRKDFESAGYGGGIRDHFVHIGEHENTHVKVLTSIIKSLKKDPVPACEYKFPLDDVHTFMTVARALENTGVSAYLGVAAGLNGALLTAAGTIVTVESRQSSFLNGVFNGLGAPYNFDTPLSPREIITMASSFITKCPYDLGVTPFKQLTATLPESEGKVVTTYKGSEAHKDSWCQFLFDNKVVVSHRSKCTLPKEVDGYVYLVITDTKTPITYKDEDHILAGPALLFKGDH